MLMGSMADGSEDGEYVLEDEMGCAKRTRTGRCLSRSRSARVARMDGG
jgi:hypothetical protein